MANQSTFAIIQLTRMGDLVQTYQACLDFKEQYPDLKLVLIARRRFVTPLRFLLDHVFDDIIEVDVANMLNSSDDNFDTFLTEAKKVISKVDSLSVDVLLNFSFCETSNYLSSAITCKNRLGTYVDENNFVSVHDQWSQVIHTMTQRGPYCPYNLVDLFKNILGISPQITNLPVEKATLTSNKRVLAIHPFASHEKKRWKPQKWVEVIYNFLKSYDGHQATLFGDKSEKEIALKIKSDPILARFSDKIKVVAGSLTIEESFNELKTCTHFIGHDSLVGHLAKVACLPTLTVALGTVREIETVPYGESSFVLSPKTNCYPCFPDTCCSFFQCHADIPYQAVNSILEQFVKSDDMDHKSIQSEVSQFHLNSINLFRADFSNTNWLYLRELTGNTLSTRDLVKTFLRVGVSYKFEEKEENFPIPELTANTYSRLQKINDGLRQLFELCEFGKNYSRYILSELASNDPKMESIKTYSARIEEIDQLMALVQKTYPELAPIIDFYTVTKSNLIGDSLVEITESSYLVYNDNATLCSIIYELIETSIKRFAKNNNLQIQPTKSQG